MIVPAIIITKEMKNITIKGDLVTLRGVMKEGDIPALEALADAIATLKAIQIPVKEAVEEAAEATDAE